MAVPRSSRTIEQAELGVMDDQRQASLATRVGVERSGSRGDTDRARSMKRWISR
jgi:hypothetical protein